MGTASVEGSGDIICRIILSPPPPCPPPSPPRADLPTLAPLLLGDHRVKAAPGEQGCSGEHLPPPPHCRTFSLEDDSLSTSALTTTNVLSAEFCKDLSNLAKMSYLQVHLVLVLVIFLLLNFPHFSQLSWSVHNFSQLHVMIFCKIFSTFSNIYIQIVSYTSINIKTMQRVSFLFIRICTVSI